MTEENPNSTIDINNFHNQQKDQTSNFFKNPNNNNNNNSKNSVNETALGACSVTDSAYDSLVCSPFSPIIISNSNQSNPIDNQENFSNTLGTFSPFLESGEADDVFKMSLEQINVDKNSGVSMRNSIFRPISSEREINENSISHRWNSLSNNSQSNTQNLYTNFPKSQRSISTQTKFSLSSTGFYRPNSAPLQEGIEEELSEIETNAMENSSHQMTRNSTCHCIRSPMPDLIQPTFQRDNQMLVNRLSFIADQIDEDMSPRTAAPRNIPRTRRFSTPMLSEMTPGGSFLDLLLSIYQAFDHRGPRRRSARYSYNEDDEARRLND